MTDMASIVALASRGDLTEAKAQCEAALRDGGTAEAWRLLALVESRLGDWSRAETAIARALVLAPDDPLSLNYQGVVLASTGRTEEALRAFDRACAHGPGFVLALVNRGNALLDLGRAAEALESFDRVASIETANADILFLRGRALLTLDRQAEAAAAFANAVAVNPLHVGALNAHADALRQAGRFDEALRVFDSILFIDPNNALALQNSATLLHMLGQREPALQRYERLAALLHARPGAPEALDYALAMALSCRRELCAWDGMPEIETELVARVKDGQTAFKPFLSLMVSDDPAVHTLCAARTWERQFGSAEPNPRIGPMNVRVGGRIRIGYLSGDFRDHPTGWLIAGLIERHDRSRFDIVAYSNGPDDGSALRMRLANAFDRFVDVSRMGDEEAAQKIAGDEIGILVDLSGLTDDNRGGVLQRRPAPVAANYLGYPGPLSAPAFDYVIADEFVIPRGEESHYGCAIARLPGTYQVNGYAPGTARPPSREGAGLPSSGVVFCAFCQTVKLSGAVFDVWMRILARVPGSVLWLLDGGAPANANLRLQAERRGIDAGRLIFAPRVEHDVHMARQGLADLVLDTWPCGAHTTASDALWAGVPVITAPGRSFASRVAGSLLRAAGLPDLIAAGLGAYEDMAVALAQSPARLAALKQRLLANRTASPLFDTDAFRRKIEAAYGEMWRRSAGGEKPESFSV